MYKSVTFFDIILNIQNIISASLLLGYYSYHCKTLPWYNLVASGRLGY